MVTACRCDGWSSLGPSSRYTTACPTRVGGFVVTAPTTLPRGIDGGGTGRAAALSAGALVAGDVEAEASEVATGAHGGGGHAVGVSAALVVAAGSCEAAGGAVRETEAVPAAFSGALTGGSPSHAVSDAAGPTAARAPMIRTRLEKWLTYMVFSAQNATPTVALMVSASNLAPWPDVDTIVPPAGAHDPATGRFLPHSRSAVRSTRMFGRASIATPGVIRSSRASFPPSTWASVNSAR